MKSGASRANYWYILSIGLMICCSPAAAHFGFYNYDIGKGTVSVIDVNNQTLLIEDPFIYADYYDYSDGISSRLWHWIPMNLSEPGPCTYHNKNLSEIAVIQPGDTVVASQCRESEWGGAIARLAGPDPDEAFVTDLFGDPRGIPVTLIGNITISVFDIVPDCMQCNLNTCKAKQSQIVLERDGTELKNQTLAPDDTLIYKDEGGSRVTARFISGRTYSPPRCGGVHALDYSSPGSDFVIHAEMLSNPIQPSQEPTPGIIRSTSVLVSGGQTGKKAPGFAAVLAAGSVIALILLMRLRNI